MLPAVLVLLTAAEICDLRAETAGQLMILHQRGASSSTIAGAADDAADPAFARNLLDRVIAAETSDDSSAAELAAYHFAAEVHADCIATPRLGD